MLHKLKLFSIILFSALILTACGSGSSSSTTPPPAPPPAAPTVSLISPANQATGVSTRPIIKILFSESVSNVNNSTVTLHSGTAGGAIIPLESFVFSSTDNTYTSVPVTPISPLTNAVLVASDAITSNQGVPLVQTTFNFTIKNTFAYVLDATGVTLCTLDQGVLSGCHNTGTTESSGSAITLSPDYKFVYVAQQTQKNILVCSTNLSTGELSNCGPVAESTEFGAFTPSSVTINPAVESAYIVSTNPAGVLQCAVNQTNGQVSSCITSNISSSLFSQPKAIAFDNESNAYITNYNGSGIESLNYPIHCKVNTGNGGFSGCALTATDTIFYNQSGIQVANGLVYIANFGSDYVNICPRSQFNGNLGGCGISAAVTFSNFNLNTISFNSTGTLMFTTNLYPTSGTSPLATCTVDKLTGVPGNCINTSPNYNFTSVNGIAVYD